MKNIDKFIDKLNSKDKIKVLGIIEQIKKGEISGFNIKKLKGKDKFYRVRKMQFRFIYEVSADNSLHVIDVSRKDDNTYN